MSIASTGGNWAGPIGQFRLELNKANAELVTLCPIPGLSLTKGGRSFVAQAADYMPTKDLKVMFVVVPSPRRWDSN